MNIKTRVEQLSEPLVHSCAINEVLRNLIGLKSEGSITEGSPEGILKAPAILTCWFPTFHFVVIYTTLDKTDFKVSKQ